MRIFFIVLVLFAAAVGLALSAHFNPGNVAIFLPPTRIDLSPNLFILLLVVGFAFLYGIIRIVRKTFQMPRRVAEYRTRQKEKRAYKALRGGLQAYLEGRYGHAEKLAGEAQELEEVQGLAALIAARAAHRMNEFSRRDAWFVAAGQDSLRQARLMTEAECLVDARDSERALEVVNALHTAGARHIQSLRLALKAHQYAGHWTEVIRLLRILGKREAIHPVAAARIRAEAYNHLFAARQNDGYALIAFWQEVPVTDRREPDIALAAARVFNFAQLGYQARVIIEGALSVQWNDRLVDEYARCIENSPTAQIERVERWTMAHPDDPHLDYALGVLCTRAKLWGKARKSLEQALRGEHDRGFAAQVHLALADLLEGLAESEAASVHFRRAARLSLDAESASSDAGEVRRY